MRDEKYEVIVSDDGTRASAEPLVKREFPWARWIVGPRRGPAANRNEGAKSSRGTWLAFVDDDCQPDPGWLAAFATATRTGSAVLEGLTYVDRPRRHPLDFSPVNTSGGVLWSCNFAILRDVFVKVGGFDERFMYNAMEDVEFNLRLRAHGHQSTFVPAARVLHPWRRIADWESHCVRHLESRKLLESIWPGAGFPSPWFAVVRAHAKTLARDHVRWFIQHPVQMSNVLPRLWRTMVQDIWFAYEYRRRRNH